MSAAVGARGHQGRGPWFFVAAVSSDDQLYPNMDAYHCLFTTATSLVIYVIFHQREMLLTHSYMSMCYEDNGNGNGNRSSASMSTDLPVTGGLPGGSLG